MTTRQIARKWESDRMVPLIPNRLRAAMSSAGLSAAAVAKRVGKGENRQTIHHLAADTETPTRCRASRRKRLARVLEVPEEWLAGETLDLSLPAQMQLDVALRRTPHAWLAVARLMARVDEATKRDLTLFKAHPDRGDHFTASDEVRSFMSWAIGRITNPAEWQIRLTRSSEPYKPSTAERRWVKTGLPPTLDDIERVSPSEEACVLNLVRAFEAILEPWLDGKAALNYGDFEAFVAATTRGARALLPNSDPPSYVTGPSGERLPPDESFTPFAVLRWAAKGKAKP